jgi:hypothetical protein
MSSNSSSSSSMSMSSSMSSNSSSINHHYHHHVSSLPPSNTNVNTSTPSHLLSRAIRKQSTLNVNDIAESLAFNVMTTFNQALEWRTKVWIQNLSKSLTNKYTKEVSKLKQQGQDTTTKKKQKKSYQTTTTNYSALKEKFKKSPEARVIKALSQTKSSIIVHDVRTAFFVLEQQQFEEQVSSSSTTTTHTEGEEEEKKDDCCSEQKQHHHQQQQQQPCMQVFHALKKRRTTVTDESSSSQIGIAKIGPSSSSKYTLTHALSLESTCSVSTSGEKKISVSLQTPGLIHGTFVRNSDGDVTLLEMSISLDTESLALSIEEKSRRVVRSAAEECIISPPYTPPVVAAQKPTLRTVSEGAFNNSDGATVSSSEDRLKFPRTFVDTTHVPSKASYVSPVMGHGEGLHEYLSSDSDDMPPPPPRLPMVVNHNNSSAMITTSYLNPRRVSPTTGLGISLISPNSTGDAMLNMNSSSSAQLVSPYLEAGEGNSKMPMIIKPLNGMEGPSLPALLEVACAEHKAH